MINPTQTTSLMNDPINSSLKSDQNLEFLSLIPAHAKVIVEVGCGSGHLASHYLPINPPCHYIGIEPDIEKAKQARDILSHVIISPLETDSLINLTRSGIEPKSVDVLIYGDLLPQLSDPQRVLTEHYQWLSPQGQVFAKIPNLQYWVNILNLLQGSWSIQKDYLDHQFTSETIQQLFKNAGLQVYELVAKGTQSEAYFKFQELSQPIAEKLGIKPEEFAKQTLGEYYIVKGINSPQPPRRLLIQTLIMAPTGCDRLRVLEPDQLMSTIPGVRTISQVRTTELVKPFSGEEKVFIWQRTIMQYPAYFKQLRQLLENDYLIVAEIDDNPIRRQEYKENQYLSYRGCHCVQTSTEPLANFLRELNPNVAVFRNQLGVLPPPRESNNSSSVTLFFGALNREKDWQPLMGALNQILKKNADKIHVKVLHDRQFFDQLEIASKDFEPFCDYQRYQEVMRCCDIALLPLLPNPINEMKSDLKFLESAGHGVTVLASPTVYEQSIIEGETGLIYRTVPEFAEKLDQLINHPSLRRKLAANAYEWVRHHRLLSQHYQERWNWYLQMRDELPRLNEELRSRLPEMFV